MMAEEPMQGALDRLTSRRFKRNRAPVLPGALAMILAVSTLIIFARPAGENAAIEAQTPEPLAAGSASLGTARRASPDEVRAYLNDMFDRLDRDGSGYVDLAEAPRLQVTSVRAGDGTIRQLPLTRAEWFGRGDEDRNGRVTRREYFARLIPPVQAIFGVPANWRPSDGERPARANQ